MKQLKLLLNVKHSTLKSGVSSKHQGLHRQSAGFDVYFPPTFGTLSFSPTLVQFLCSVCVKATRGQLYLEMVVMLALLYTCMTC